MVLLQLVCTDTYVTVSNNRDPFRGGDNILVLCDAYEPPRATPDGTVGAPKPIPTNSRFSCAAVMEKAKDQEPW